LQYYFEKNNPFKHHFTQFINLRYFEIFTAVLGWLGMELGFGAWLFIFLAVSALVTLLIKRFTKADTYFLISLIKTKRPLPFFERMAKNSALLDKFTSLGLILGFGAVAVDFLYGKKLDMLRRIVLFLGSFSILAGLLFAIDLLLGRGLSGSSLIGPYFPLLIASFGLLGLAGFTLFSLILQAASIIGNYLVGKGSCPGVAPLVPGIEIPGVPITPPLHAWISLLIILVCHEVMHGIVGRRHGFEIKSTGILLFGFLPIGAFVEPDEKEIAGAPGEKVVHFLAAGPMANIALMAIAGLILAGSLAVAGPLTNSLYPGVAENSISAVKVSKVLAQTEFCSQIYPSPAANRLKEKDIITAINGVPVRNLQDLFTQLQNNRFAPKEFTLDRNGSAVNLTLEPNELGQFGFVPEGVRNPAFNLPQSFPLYASVVNLVVDFLYWLFLLNFLVASINFLPVNPFDGGRISRKIFSPYLWFLNESNEQKQAMVGKFFAALILLLFVINAMPLFFK